MKKIKIINTEELDNLTEQEIKFIENFAKQPLVQQNLANLFFNNALINPDIILIGTLILFCVDSPDIVEKRLLKVLRSNKNRSEKMISRNHTLY